MLTNIIAAHAAKLDPGLPAILVAHVGVASATVGSERLMTIGQEHFLLLGNVANPAFDYIALGHIHKHQVLSHNPPVVYAGSLERLDFGEEEDDKGFYLVDIEPARQPARRVLAGGGLAGGTDQPAGKRVVSFDFHPITGRRFLTINVNIEPEDTDPPATVLKTIAEQGAKVSGAIVRLQISLPAETTGQFRGNDIREALKEAHYFTIARDVKQEARSRLGQLTAEEIMPLEALKTYLESKKVSPAQAKLLLEYGERLIEEQGIK